MQREYNNLQGWRGPYNDIRINPEFYTPNMGEIRFQR
jgi:hypothetical protein